MTKQFVKLATCDVTSRSSDTAKVSEASACASVFVVSCFTLLIIIARLVMLDVAHSLKSAYAIHCMIFCDVVNEHSSPKSMIMRCSRLCDTLISKNSAPIWRTRRASSHTSCWLQRQSVSFS